MIPRGGVINSIGGLLLDIILPPKCHHCGIMLGGDEEFILTEYEGVKLCRSCLSQISWIGHPLCWRCGIPFPTPAGEDHLCSNCLKRRPYFDRARAPAAYVGVMMELVTNYKYRNRQILSRPLGRMLAHYCPEIIDLREIELLIPVPLHRKRLRERGFNQALNLARELTHHWPIPLNLNSLKRVSYTAPQTSLKSAERRKNVRGAFQVVDDRAVKGKNILLVDDVYTTGSTVNECARVLKRAGAKRVEVLTLARAV